MEKECNNCFGTNCPYQCQVAINNLREQLATKEAEILRLQGDVANRNKDAIEGRKASVAFDKLFEENECLREALVKINSMIPHNPRLPLVWEIKLIVDDALAPKEASDGR